MKIIRNIKLAKYNTFHIGGRAEYFVEIRSIKELEEAVIFAKNKNLNIFVLGGGSNVLLPDKGIKGLVLLMAIKGIAIKDKGGQAFVSVGSGQKWDRIVAKTVKNGLSGIENLSLIPGTFGGAIYQNIGAYGSELKDVLESVEVFDTKSLAVIKLTNKDCQFGYRDSIFQKSEGKNLVILEGTLKLDKHFEPKITYPDLVKYFEKKTPTLTTIREAVIKIRKSKLDYPTNLIGTAGSFFKNPIVTASDFKKLSSNYPDIKGRAVDDGLIKLFAGQLTEKAGWKGKRIGNVGVSKSHAMVLISRRGAGSKEILELMRKIQLSVKNKFGISLEPEVKVIR